MFLFIPCKECEMFLWEMAVSQSSLADCALFVTLLFTELQLISLSQEETFFTNQSFMELTFEK